MPRHAANQSVTAAKGLSRAVHPFRDCLHGYELAASHDDIRDCSSGLGIGTLDVGIRNSRRGRKSGQESACCVTTRLADQVVPLA